MFYKLCIRFDFVPLHSYGILAYFNLLKQFFQLRKETFILR